MLISYEITVPLICAFVLLVYISSFPDRGSIHVLCIYFMKPQKKNQPYISAFHHNTQFISACHYMLRYIKDICLNIHVFYVLIRVRFILKCFSFIIKVK